MSLTYSLQYNEYTLHSAAEDNEFNESRHKQSMRREGSICVRDCTKPMTKHSDLPFQNFSTK